MEPTQTEQLESLLLEWEAGTLDETGVERLRSVLRESESAREQFARFQLMSAALWMEGDTRPVNSLDAIEEDSATVTEVANRPATITSAKSAGIKWGFWATVVAGMLVTVLVSRLIYLEWNNRSRVIEGEGAVANIAEQETAEATSHGVAILTRLVDIEWGDQLPHEEGDALTPGRLFIASGYAQVEFFCGATVVLEGPAELELKSPMLARVHKGRLRAQVPPAARGFSLEVDDVTVVDLGTEFGLDVSSNGANVQVFDGEVEVVEASDQKRKLTTGQGLVRNAEGEFSPGTVTPDRFLDIATLNSRDLGQRDARYEKWKSWSAKLRKDPRLIAYYAFDNQADWQRKLLSSLVPENHELDGAIVGARQVAGRWPDKGGLEFKRPGDRVRVQIPGEYGSLTLACWVKIDSLDRWYNSLFLTDNYNQGEPHWQILDTGQLFFSVRAKPDDVRGRAAKGPTHQTVLSPSFWEPSMSGKWLHLATTYDVAAGRTTHYLNGELLHSEQIPPAQLVETTRIGAASIGNWSLPTKPDAEFAIRNLNGTMDEMVLFAAALSADEIKEMFEHGKP